MKYDVQEVSAVSRKITVNVPAEEANAALITTVALYKSRYEVKGFRKGKAPMNLIEAQFRSQIYGEATTDLINYHINDILGQLKLAPMSRIDVDAGLLERDEDFSYSFSFEVAPHFELPTYIGLPVEEERVEVREEEITEVEARILDNAATSKVIDEVRRPDDGEIVTVSFGAYQGDQVVSGIKSENFELTLGQNQALPEFEELVKSLTTGEEGQKDITFPADFINTDLAGRTVTMKVKLHAIKKKVLPEMSDEVAKKAGFESVEKMREAIRGSYMQNRKQLVKSAAQKKLLDGLLKTLDFPLPPSLVEDRVDRLIKDLEYRLDRKGKSLAGLGKDMDQLRSEYRSEAEQGVRAELFLLAVAQKEDLQVSPQEIDAVINQMAMQTRQDFMELKRYYEDNNLVAALKDRILADKAMDQIYQKADRKEVEPAAPEAPKAKAKKAAKTEESGAEKAEKPKAPRKKAPKSE